MENTLWYRSFTQKYMEGLPLGNGRLAAMVLGSPEKARIALNHEWMWRGENRFRDVEDVSSHLPEVRQALLAGDYETGTHLANVYFGGKGGISGERGRVDPYEPVGDIFLTLSPGDVSDYHRQLNLETGIATTTFFGEHCGRVNQETFVSAADQCGVILLRTEQNADHHITLSRIPDERCTLTHQNKEDSLILKGQFIDGIAFCAKVCFVSDGMLLPTGDGITLRHATETLLLYQIGTSAKGGSPEEEMVFPSLPWDYNALKSRHIACFASLYVDSSLQVDGPISSLPTDQRIEAFREGKDPLVPVLYFNYGRYLMVSGSSGELPLHLQGKWNEELNPPWESDYHLTSTFKCVIGSQRHSVWIAPTILSLIWRSGTCPW